MLGTGYYTETQYGKKVARVSDPERYIQSYGWIQKAHVFNKNFEMLPSGWIEGNADTVVILFTAKGIDRKGIIRKFCTMYEHLKAENIPIEVIFVSMDENEDNMLDCYEHQANWFTLKFTDPLVLILMYHFQVTSIPSIFVIKPDGTVVSRSGIQDLEKYGKNAVITWLGPSISMKCHRDFDKEAKFYGDKWKYLHSIESMKMKYKAKYFGQVPDNTTENDTIVPGASDPADNEDDDISADRDDLFDLQPSSDD